MNQRVSAILLIALLLSAGATYIVYRSVNTRPSTTTVATVQVVQAAKTLELGALIQEQDLTMGPWVGTVPPGVQTKKDGLVGRGVIATIYAGEPVMTNRLAPIGGGAGLAATIPTGMRACAVRVNEIVGVAGFASPGMRVDILIAGIPPGTVTNTTGPHVKTLLQNIQVLSAGQNYQKDAEGKPAPAQVVNLLVTPEQAEILSLASNETRIQLVLRNPLDMEPAKVPGTMMSTLYGAAPVAVKRVEAAPAPRPRPATVPVVMVKETVPTVAHAAPPPYHIEIFNGGKQSEAKFSRGREEKQ